MENKILLFRMNSSDATFSDEVYNEVILFGPSDIRYKIDYFANRIGGREQFPSNRKKQNVEWSETSHNKPGYGKTLDEFMSFLEKIYDEQPKVDRAEFIDKLFSGELLDEFDEDEEDVEPLVPAIVFNLVTYDDKDEEIIKEGKLEFDDPRAVELYNYYKKLVYTDFPLPKMFLDLEID